MAPSDLSPLSLDGRRYDSADSATNGRSDVESVSGSSRLTSRQHSLESRQSLDLSDRWVSPEMLQCECCRVRACPMHMPRQAVISVEGSSI